MNIAHLSVVDPGKVAAKVGLVFGWLIAESIIGVIASALALGYATEHVHDVSKMTVNNVVHVTHHNFDHSVAGIMAVSAAAALLWFVISIAITAAAVAAWQEID